MSIQGPPARQPGWLPVLIGLAAFIVTAVALGLVAWDWTGRNMEMNALVTAVEASEDAMGRTQEDLAATAARLRTLTSDAQKQRAIDDLVAGAQRGEMRIGSAGEVVGQVPVLPWHADIVEAKEAYIAHNLSWQVYMAAIAADPKVYGTDQPVIDATFMAADPLMRAAVPDPPLFDLAQRVDRIFVEGAGPPPAPDGQEVAGGSEAVALRVD